jgi:hypothetical protein
MQMAENDLFVTCHKVKIDNLWPLAGGSFVYKGCPVLLGDGRPCALGKHKRRLQRQDSKLLMGPHSRCRPSHVCCADGEGQQMYFFAIKIDDKVMKVHEDIGTILMGMSGQHFFDKVKCDPAEVEFICDEVRSVPWTICLAKDAREGSKVVSVHCHNDLKRQDLDGEKSVVQKLCDAALDFIGEIVDPQVDLYQKQ